ncbi:uncharacterized protein EDB91DRAFT_1086153 [Suillus paluster]|uniref:uncharacterized protein n=1 Tax=Suillus paluster TaxID=48578 RepID=UPI001B878EFD|nr:uncharacterized protein EDB91DRAFT_1086153 [Suillus paluster]KAG1728277.1 hypothetical protein EDB91DRAFT_1086153 [Suillus paluster]
MSKISYSEGRAALQSLHALSKQEQEDLLKEFTEQRETKTLGLHILMKSKGITFTTEGVQNFMGSVMGINNQDFMSKMEGFAIQGMKGTRKNSIKFANLSNVSSTLPDLKMLEQQWELSATKWITIDDNELKKLHLEHSRASTASILSTSILPHLKRKQSAVSKGNANQHKIHKSAEFIESSDEEGEEGKPDQPPTITTSPAAQSATAPSADESGPSTHPTEQFNTLEFPQFNAHEFAQLNAHEFTAGSSLPPFNPDATLAHLNTLFSPDNFLDFGDTI